MAFQPSTRFPQPSYQFAKRHGVLVGEQQEGDLTVMFRPPLKPTVVAELRRFLETPFNLKQVKSDDFERFLSDHYEGDGNTDLNSMADMGDELDLDDFDSLAESQDLLDSDDDAPIIRFINTILKQAIKEGASDIHFEPYENQLIVRTRVDGILHEITTQPSRVIPVVISRLKVMAELDIAEKRIPQDGRITRKVGGKTVDMRVSTLPSGSSERVVLRLLDRQAGKLTMEQLGMSKINLEGLNKCIEKPHGIFLVTGPTGSGKTTTLYASLDKLNDSKRNILTVEDPIEYYIDGIGQTQVNNKVDMSFSRGLRAILRQDPDVVMVGEIRDLETAEISVQASLTGHMVFSTLHTNTAIGAITRLRDMGVEPFLLSSTVTGVLAQRLVRRLCEHCKEPHEMTESEANKLGMPENINSPIFKSRGCSQCNNLGYAGRTGIHELVTIDDEIQTLIHDGAGEHELEKVARKTSGSILDDGAQKVLLGITTIEEVLRVCREA